MPHVARREHCRLLDGEDAVAQHPLSLAIDQPDRQAAGVILPRGDDVERILREQLRPVRERAIVQHIRIGGVELLDLLAQQQPVDQRVRCGGAFQGSHGHGVAPQTPMTPRQCLYMARIADSGISVSPVPASVLGSSATSCAPPGTCFMPSCTNFIASLSSSPRKPAGPIRLPWRSRWRVISSSAPSKPNIVQIMVNWFGPSGTIWRTPSVFISRCTIRFGQMVDM